jgi:GDSL-like Lipase/Acylhydrolase family
VAYLICFLRRLLVGTVILYTFVVLTLGGTVAAKPAFYGLAVGWMLFLLLLAMRARPVQETRPYFHMLEVTGTNVALAIFLCEVCLRAFAAVSGDPLLLNAAMESYRLSPGKDYGGGLYGNSLGYPGREFEREKHPGVLRIAALGDSFAIGPAVPFADNYLTRLDQSLPHVEVYNFGVAGIGPREYLSILGGDVWSYQPDLILLSIFVGNDITESLATPRHLDPRQHALCLLCQRAWRIGWGAESCGSGDTSTSDRLSKPPLSIAAFRAIEARRLAVCFRCSPDGMEKKWARTLAYLEEFVQDCHRHGVPLAVVLIPDEFQVNPAVQADAITDAGVSTSGVDIELPQQRLRAFFQLCNVPCLDLLPAFASTPGTYAVHDTHWNVAGNRLAADEIANWLKGLPCFAHQNRSLSAVPGDKVMPQKPIREPR